MSLEPGAKVDQYEILAPLGSGGMGEVWLADDPVGRSVALKVLGTGTLAPERALRRFMREAHVLVRDVPALFQPGGYAATVVLLAGTMSTMGIVEAQQVPFILILPVAFAIGPPSTTPPKPR